MAMRQEEALIRDFLAARLDHFADLIDNLRAVRDALDAEEQRFGSIRADNGGPSAAQLIRRVLAKRHLRGLGSINSIELIDTEFGLLRTGKSGFQPSADILARNPIDNRLFLIEVKQLVGTERESVTELSAYSQGLLIRFWNLSAADQTWIPICTEWRTTVRAAFANEALWQNRSVLPMLCKVKKSPKGVVKEVKLELLSLLDDIEEPTALAQFGWYCFDTIALEFHEEPSDPSALANYLATTAARFGFSGCVLYGESLAGKAFPDPYVFAIAIQNPFSAALKARQLKIVRDDKDHGGLAKMRREVKEPIWDLFDIDFSTMMDRESPTVLLAAADQQEGQGNHELASQLRAEAQEEYHSVQEMADASRSRDFAFMEEVRANLRPFCSFRMSTPSLKGLFSQGIPVLLDHVSYFGLMQEVVYERLYWEVLNAEGEDGPVTGDIKGGPMGAIESPQFFFDFMELMNFEHGLQSD